LANLQGQVDPEPENGYGVVLGLAAALAGLCSHARRQVMQADCRLHFVAVLAPRSRPAETPHVAIGNQLLGTGCRWVLVWPGHGSNAPEPLPQKSALFFKYMSIPQFVVFHAATALTDFRLVAG
jgi:hypothetical protein